MKFIVDGMLGGLARWLRILGHEVVYDKTRNDTALLNSALQNDMILLTRDKELSQRATARNVRTLLVTGLREEERMAQVARKFDIPLEVDVARTRCPECGTELREASRNQVAGSVPVKSQALYKEFWQCKNPVCGKVYWRGSHWKQITTALAKARKLAETI